MSLPPQALSPGTESALAPPANATVGPRAVGPSVSETQRGLQASNVLSEIGAGATVGLIALPVCVTAGVLAYEPLGRDYVGVGAAAGILCAVVGGFTGAIARSSSFIPNVPSVPMAMIQASFLSGLLGALGGDVGAVLVVMPLSIIGAGLWQLLIAGSGLARAVKFTPYPVLAGFVTGLAVLTFVQQLPRLFDAPSLATLGAWLAELHVPSPALPLLGLGIVLLIRVLEGVAPRLPAMLVALVAGTLLWHALVALWPDLGLGRTIGTVSLEGASFGLKLETDTFRYVILDRAILQSLLLTSLTLALLGTLDYTFAFRAAQNLGDLHAAPRRDLAGQGLSNLAAATAGGLAVTSSLAFTATNFASGGRSRVSTIALASVLLAAAALTPGLIGALPTVVLSGILVSISLKMWDRWCLVVVRDMLWAGDRAARTRARRNGFIVVAVAAATVLGQPVVGALAGVLFSCLVFIVEMSRPVVRRRLDGGKIASKRIRSQADAALLRERAGRIAVLELQGVLFFGNADELAVQIKGIEAEADLVILDLCRVTDLDTSGASVLQTIAGRCAGKGLRLVLCGARPSYRPLLEAALLEFPGTLVLADLDTALERAESVVLERDTNSRRDAPALRLHQTDLAAGLSERELACLKERLTLRSYPAGTALCRAGDAADQLWLLTRGSVSIRVAGADHDRRIAGLGPGTTVGEMGLLDRQPRSADVVADDDVEAYVLSLQDFEALLRDEPHLGQSLLATVARLTASRLRATSNELRLMEI